MKHVGIKNWINIIEAVTKQTTKHVDIVSRSMVNIPTETIEVKHYHTLLSDFEKKFYSIRDHCGNAAADMIQKLGWNPSERVFGYIRLDIPISEKADFTLEMKLEMQQQGFDFNSKQDRYNFISNSEYCEEWKQGPHYWILHNGVIHDPTGKMYQRYINGTIGRDRYIAS